MKNKMREKARDIISKLQKEKKEMQDNLINNNIIKLNEYRNAKTIFCFIGKENEINTRLIIEDALACGKTIAVPKCINNEKIEAYKIKSYNDLEIGVFGILEPKLYCEKILKEEITLGIIPCLCADSKGNRLGYGKGFYDRYLANVKFIKIGLCREDLIFEEIPIECHDIPMDMIITEKFIFQPLK